MHLSVAQEHTAEKYGAESHRPEQKPRKIAAEAENAVKLVGLGKALSEYICRTPQRRDKV